MNTSKHRHDGGAYRRMKTVVSYHAKPGKDRSKANRQQPKREGESGQNESVSSLRGIADGLQGVQSAWA